MALKNLSTQNMVNLSADLVKAGSPQRDAIEAVPTAKALLPHVIAAHRGLLDAQPIVNVEVAKLTTLLGDDDARHDTLVRAIHTRLEAESFSARDQSERESIARAREALFPAGTSIITRSWSEQVGEAKLRAARVTDAVERTIERMTCSDGATVLEQYRELQKVTTRIDANDKRRAALAGEGPTGSATVKARNQWIRVINALATVLDACGVDEAPIMSRIRAFEAKLEREDEPTITPAPTPTPMPTEPVVVDPPASA